MRNLKFLLYTLAGLSLLYADVSQAMSLSNAQIEAENVIRSYHLALTQGDTTTIKALLGGDLLKKRRKLLDNPTYPAHLLNVYSGSTIEIVNNTSENNSISITAKIILGTGEIQGRDYLLKQNNDPASTYRYIIYSDTSAGQDSL